MQSEDGDDGVTPRIDDCGSGAQRIISTNSGSDTPSSCNSKPAWGKGSGSTSTAPLCGAKPYFSSREAEGKKRDLIQRCAVLPGLSNNYLVMYVYLATAVKTDQLWSAHKGFIAHHGEPAFVGYY